MWELIKSTVPDPVKVATLVKMDEVLGFNISDHIGYEIPVAVIDMARTRFEYRKSGIWDKADLLRKAIEAEGFVVEDIAGSFKLKRKA
jgi:cysteinyl-tRNA synthetase